MGWEKVKVKVVTMERRKRISEGGRAERCVE